MLVDEKNIHIYINSIQQIIQKNLKKKACRTQKSQISSYSDQQMNQQHRFQTNHQNKYQSQQIPEQICNYTSQQHRPKHLIAIISKKIIFKNRQVIINIFNILQFISYQCQLSLYSQISTKEFLKKISGLLINKDLDQQVKQKILQTLFCWNQLFRPHEDLLPIFFQFYAGVLRNGFAIPYQYQSKYRPSQLKIYKKIQQKSSSKATEKKNEHQLQSSTPPTLLQLKTFQQIRQQLILTNQIIDNSNPSDNIKQNGLLLQMIEHLKQCQKKVNKTINQNPNNQKLMELALAANDDIFITYRRFKDLQKNNKPQPFILTELVSDLHREQHTEKRKKNVKVQEKASTIKQQHNVLIEKEPSQVKKQLKNDKKIDSLFDWDTQPVKKSQSKNQKQDILDIVDQNNQPQNNAIPQPENQKNSTYQQPQSQANQQNKTIGELINLQQNNTLQQSNNINNINFDTLLITTQNYQGMTMPSPSEYGIAINANDFRTQVDIKNYNNQSAFQKLEELTYKFLKK